MDEIDFDDLPDYTVTDAPVKPHRFKAVGEVWEAAPVIPVEARKIWVREIVDAFDTTTRLPKPGVTEDTLADAFGRFMDVVLYPESAERLAKGMRDAMQPISDNQLIAMAVGLVSYYTGFPTPPLSFSNDGGNSEEENLTGTPLTTELIPSDSPTSVT